MRKVPSLWVMAALAAAGAFALAGQLSIRADAQAGIGLQGIAPSAVEQIAALTAMKQSFTAAEQKMDSNLVLAARVAGGAIDATGVAGIVRSSALPAEGRVAVDIYGDVSAALLDAIAAAGGTVIEQSGEWGIIHAALPLTALATVAAQADVKSVQQAAEGTTNAGGLTSQGYVSHTANQAVNMGVDGAGVTVGVMSDTATQARVQALIASGDLPATTRTLPGQGGPTTGADEGIAMMEIVHDLAPGADLIFATAATGVVSFANNILALRAAGAQVIVDDYTYFNEGAFQDGPIARAVNQVTADGALYFSSAANSGSLTLGTSGTWEGYFLPDDAALPPLAGRGIVHNFGAAGSPQAFNVLTGSTVRMFLKWSDPLGASTNDYDLYVLNPAGTAVVAASLGSQTGTQDPYEFVSNAAGFAVGSRIVVVLYAGSTRALRLDASRGRLGTATAGSTFGHNAGASTVSTAATYWNSARTGTRPFAGFPNPNEPFSSDGPRRMFFNPNGTPITPGNVLFSTNGGIVLQKPDIAAADGVSTRTPGFMPFFGTSAAAPHAAAIAALIRSARPDYTNAQVLDAIRSTARDSMAVGVDRDSGFGIVMAWPAVQYALTH
jgi:Subtilase family